MNNSVENKPCQLMNALSPSKITQYFENKGSRRRGAHKECASKGVSLETDSVYLTPESSPGTVDNYSLRRECEDLPPSPQVLVGDDMSSEINQTATSGNDSLLEEGGNGCKEKSSLGPPEGKTQSSDSVTSDNSKSVSPLQTGKGDTLVLESATKGPVARRAVSPAKSKKNSNLPFVDSPSVPRSKLRKNATAGAAAASDSEPVKPRPGRKKKLVVTQTNTITDYFPVRRSGRQTKREIEKEKQSLTEKLILSDCEDGLKVQEFENKGRGIVATKDFDKGDFVIEYAGKLLDIPTARSKEFEYGKNPEVGCYMYFFKCGPKQYCVDATAESDRLGRLINHSRDGNCCTKSLMVNEIPRLILVAKRDIKCGEELSYDYGDRSKAALEAHPWLKS